MLGALRQKHSYLVEVNHTGGKIKIGWHVMVKRRGTSKYRSHHIVRSNTAIASVRRKHVEKSGFRGIIEEYPEIKEVYQITDTGRVVIHGE